MSILKLYFPWFGLSFSVSQQSLITTDKMYMVERESFKKAKVKTFIDHPKTALQQFVVEGGGEYYLGQLSLQATGFLVFLWKMMLNLIISH